MVLHHNLSKFNSAVLKVFVSFSSPTHCTLKHVFSFFTHLHLRDIERLHVSVRPFFDVRSFPVVAAFNM